MKGFAINMASVGLLSTPRYREQQAWVKTERRKSKLLIYLIGLALLAFFCSLFYVWSRIQMVNVGYEINREIHLKERLLEENKRLTLETATLKSPVRLEALAKREYGMDLPMKSQIVGDPTFRAPAVAQVPQKAAPKKTVAAAAAPLKAKAAPAKTTVAKASPTEATKSESVKKAVVAKTNSVSLEKNVAATAAPKTQAKAVVSKTERTPAAPVAAPKAPKVRDSKVAVVSNLITGQ